MSPTVVRTWIVLALSLCVACSNPPADTPADAAAASDVGLPTLATPLDEPWPESGPAPAPFTPEQIRASNPDGTEVVFSLTKHGSEPITQTMRFVDGDAEGVTVESWYHAADGERIGEPSSSRALWTELRDHAVFDAPQTTRGEGHEVVGAGSFDCWIYHVRGETDDGVIVQRYAFAKDRAGPPVLLEVVAGTLLVSRMELVEVRPGG